MASYNSHLIGIIALLYRVPAISILVAFRQEHLMFADLLTSEEFDRKEPTYLCFFLGLQCSGFQMSSSPLVASSANILNLPFDRKVACLHRY